LSLELGDLDKAGALLQVYVDEWLDTGVEADGGEGSRLRDFTKAPNARRALWKLFSHGRSIRYSVRRDDVSVDISNLVPVSLQSLAAARTSEETAKDAADRLFALFSLSEWHVRLAKCRRAGCGRYFELKHWNRSYKKGMFCPECTRIRSSQCAMLSTSRVRKKAEGELYRQVARRFGKRIAKLPDWHRDPKLRAEIIEFVNERTTEVDSLRTVYRRPLTGKWLSWSKNRGGIESAVKGKVHAESQRT
jgi:hypothetical protein